VSSEAHAALVELDATLSSLADGLIIFNPAGQVVYVNELAAHIFRYSPAQQQLSVAERTAALQMVAGDGTPFAPDALPVNRALRGESTHGVVLGLQHPAEFFWLSTNTAPIYDAHGTLLGAVATFTDITAHKHTEQALRESEETATALLNATPDAAFLLDIQGTILAANEPLAIRVRCPVDELIGRSILDFLSPAEVQTQAQYVAEVRQTRRRTSFETEVAGRWLDNSIAPILDAQGQVVRLAIFSRDITAHKQMELQLHHLAYSDPLTGLPNRVTFNERLAQALARSKRQSTALAVLFLDLDHFKTINDTLGHPVGDLLLQEVARRLRACLREEDTVARLGGDEFVLLLQDLGSARVDAEATARRILTALAAPLHLREHTITPSTSIGIALAPVDGTTPEALLKHADLAMYRAKESGRNTFRFHSDTHQSLFTERQTLTTELQRALTHSNLRLAFQPQYDLQGGRLLGLEALLRWHHPDLGVIPPLQFLPVIEDTPMATVIGAWVLREGCLQLAAWHASGLAHLKLAVNVSPKQFAHPEFVATVQAALQASGLSPTDLEIELPESLVVHNLERAQQVMGALHALGVRIAIDDVGLGSSSVAYLPELPISVLKIDGAFIREIATDQSSLSTVRSLIEVGHHYGLATIAECVETREQQALLRTSGCDQAQGYLFTRPLYANECLPFLRTIQPTGA
jgi:diguanylate cyclase (GGDEF)-like protein/PAS domain S-box-containing protein